MASISRSADGRRRIQFTGPDGIRKTLRLGQVSQRTADSIRRRVELLLVARTTGDAVDVETATWLRDIGDDLHKRIVAVGLATPRQPAATAPVLTLGELLTGYFDRRTDAKPASKIVWGHTRRNLLEFFGDDKPIADITPAAAKDFERYLATTARENGYGDKSTSDGLSPDTIRKRIGIAKQFFADAVDRELLPRNPFAKLKSTVKGNRERDYYVSREATQKLIDAAPDAQWRLIIALSRYGGLRCPSEHLALRLDDVDVERLRIRITSPKTEHHEGKAWRYIPLFPELRPYLDAVWHAAEPGTEHFITRYRRNDQNLRTTFLKIIKRAGLTPWPKLFHNMRASRQTELEETFPSHVVCSWIGNSPQVAKRHYLQVTDEHFERASQADAKSDASLAQNVTQIPTQPVAATVRHDDTSDANLRAGKELCHNVARGGKTWPPETVDDEGLEPTHKNKRNSRTGPRSDAESDAFTARSPETPPDLQAVIDAWPALPEPLRAGILAMVRGVAGPRG